MEIRAVREGCNVFIYVPIKNASASIKAKEGQATRYIKEYCRKLYELGETIRKIDRLGYVGYSQREMGGQAFYAFHYQIHPNV